MTNSDKVHGGPAFPILQCSPGMMLRDYFAAKAMQGIMAEPNFMATAEVASQAYELADAMLAERAK